MSPRRDTFLEKGTCGEEIFLTPLEQPIPQVKGPASETAGFQRQLLGSLNCVTTSLTSQCPVSLSAGVVNSNICLQWNRQVMHLNLRALPGTEEALHLC